MFAFDIDDTIMYIVGHAAMEAACTNLVEDGDTVLVAVNGLWGDRFADMSTRHGLYKLIVYFIRLRRTVE